MGSPATLCNSYKATLRFLGRNQKTPSFLIFPSSKQSRVLPVWTRSNPAVNSCCHYYTKACYHHIRQQKPLTASFPQPLSLCEAAL